jgi:hypothetical protein
MSGHDQTIHDWIPCPKADLAEIGSPALITELIGMRTDAQASQGGAHDFSCAAPHSCTIESDSADTGIASILQHMSGADFLRIPAPLEI